MIIKAEWEVETLRTAAEIYAGNFKIVDFTEDKNGNYSTKPSYVFPNLNTESMSTEHNRTMHRLFGLMKSIWKKRFPSIGNKITLLQSNKRPRVPDAEVKVSLITQKLRVEENTSEN